MVALPEEDRTNPARQRSRTGPPVTTMARGGSARNQLLGVGVYVLSGAGLVGATDLLLLWMTNGR